MPFYAAEGQVSTSPIDGGIEITGQQYSEAIAGMLAGNLVTIDGGFAVVPPPIPEPEPDPEPEPGLPQPQLYAVALLTIDNGEISGIDVASKFSAALWLDVGLYYIFFAETQSDTAYLAKAYDDVSVVRVIEKTTDYIVVTAADSNGNPADPAEISVEIIKVS